MSFQVDHAVDMTSKFLVGFISLIANHSGFAIAFVLLAVGLMFSRAKTR
jgi:hypothetical protein